MPALLQPFPTAMRSAARSAAFLATVWIAGCGDTPDPRALPYRLVEENSSHAPAAAVDLDGDGADEIVFRYTPSQMDPGGMTALWLRRPDGRTINQINFDGLVLPPSFLDMDDDGRPEIVAPVLRGDSLFVTASTGSGTKLFSFLLTTGVPRVETDGVLPWDPQVHEMLLTDVDGDGVRDLVTVVLTGYARHPRGVFAHRVPTGELIGSAVVGAQFRETVIDDIDGDGDLEILAITRATENGARAGGLDDSHAYLLEFELSPRPRVSRWREISRHESGRLALADFDADGVRDLLVFRAGHVGIGALPMSARMQLLDPVTWEVRRERVLSEPLADPEIIDVDRDGHPEIAALRGAGEIWIFDGDFDVLRKRRLWSSAVFLNVVEDLDGDGVEELVATMDHEGAVILDGRLRTLAFHPLVAVTAERVRTAVGVRPLLLLADLAEAVVLRSDANPFVPVYRYGPAAAGILLTVLMSGFAYTYLRDRRELRLLRAIEAVRPGRTTSACLVLDPAGRVRWHNDVVRGWSNGAAAAGAGVELDHAGPELTAFCAERLADPAAAPAEKTLTLTLPEGPTRVRAAAEPLLVPSSRRPHWFVHLTRDAPGIDPEQGRTWGIMAQRVAHDLRNPLTSILLTVQRMEMEYRENAPGLAPRLDAYSMRIQQRIEHLRRMTTNFMKFVDAEAPNRVVVDLAVLLRDVVGTMGCTMPPDVSLRLTLSDPLPAVLADADQIRSVLENLVANAVNALPAGGRIRIMAEAVSVGVRVGVADTGVGIAAEHLPHLFAAGFTTRPDGSGLGLAMVRKIIRDHGGVVEVETRSGVGTTFTFTLPAAARPADRTLHKADIVERPGTPAG